MAGEWIKVRAALPRDPRVMKMAEALRKCGSDSDDVNESVTLRVTVCVTVVALQTVWCMADEVGKADGNDVIITGVNAEHLTHSLDLPGFADAMKDVGWLVEDAGGVRFPNLLKYNVLRDSSSAKNAERQRRYRERKAAEESPTTPTNQPPSVRNVTSNVTRNVTPLLSSPVLSCGGGGSNQGGVGGTPDALTARKLELLDEYGVKPPDREAIATNPKVKPSALKEAWSEIKADKSVRCKAAVLVHRMGSKDGTPQSGSNGKQTRSDN